jgi:simple sugar transport system permease protein
MASANLSGAPANLSGDERVRNVGSVRKLLARPEFGAIAGTLLVVAIFVLAAGDSGMFSAEGTVNWGTVAGFLGIIAVGAALLMIAGEFDLSVGSMIGFSGIVIAILTVQWGWPAWAAILASFAVALAIGALNGLIVIRTGLPSFIVTLAALYILRGLTIWLSILFTRQTIIGGVTEASTGDWLGWAFGGKVLPGLFVWLAEIGLIGTFDRGARVGQPVIDGIPMVIVWALALIVFGHVLLTRTRFGNWIFASGGDAQAARYVGVPVSRVKVLMFMFTAFCATVFATCQVMEFGSAAADRGLLKEFEAIICVVIGGALLTGGYGSVVGAALGALIFGVVQQGLFFAGAESSLFRVFLGTILILAVIMNTYIRRMITGER